MPIIPEKRQLEDHVLGAVASQFWSQGIQNSRSLTGQSCTAPCEPQPLRLNAPSGLSRAQFLVATQAVRVPVFPGYCDEHGGTVADRVLVQHGGQNWWGALIGRAKVQRLVKQRANTRLRANLADPDNYALAATGRLQLSHTTTLRATMQVDSLQQLQPIMPQGPRWLWQQQQQQQPARTSSSSGQQLWQRHSWPKAGQGGSLSLQLKQQLEGLDLTADLAVNEPSVEGVHRYCTTPLRLAVDLAPSSNSSSKAKDSWMQGLLFRVGLHGAVAPIEGHTTAAAAASDPQQQQQQQQQHTLSVHCQGAIAVVGNKTLWQARQKPWQAAAEEAKQQQRVRKRQQQEQQQQRRLGAEQLAAAATDSVGSSSASEGTNGSQIDTAAATAGSSEAPSLSSSSSSKDSKAQRKTTRASSRQATARSTVSSSGKKQYLTLRGEEIPLPLCNPASVQEGLQEASSAIERLRTDLRSWRSRVESGELSTLGAAKKSSGLLTKEPGSCWSSFIHPPHIKVAGLVGLLSRVPLQQHTLLSSGSSSSSGGGGRPVHSSSSTSLAASEQAATDEAAAGSGSRTQPSGKPLSRRAKSFLAASATHLDRMVLGSARKLGTSITQDSTLRLFASGAASMQLGEMRGNFFDFTRIEAAIDLGLNAPESAVAPAAAAAARPASSHRRHHHSSSRSRTAAAAGVRAPSPRRGMETILGPAAAADLPAAAAPPQVPAALAGPSSSAPEITPPIQQQQLTSSSSNTAAVSKHKHPAFALEERSVWHALTVSATQQLIGPVRLRGDWRFALDSSKPWPRGAGLLQPSAPLQLVKHVAGISPALVDSAIGLDVVVPGSGGVARVVGWWSPNRREGGLEVRLM